MSWENCLQDAHTKNNLQESALKNHLGALKTSFSSMIMRILVYRMNWSGNICLHIYCLHFIILCWLVVRRMHSESNLCLRGSCKLISNLHGVALSFDSTMFVNGVIEQFQSIPESFLPRFVFHRSSPVSIPSILWIQNWCSRHHWWSFG